MTSHLREAEHFCTVDALHHWSICLRSGGHTGKILAWMRHNNNKNNDWPIKHFYNRACGISLRNTSVVTVSGWVIFSLVLHLYIESKTTWERNYLQVNIFLEWPYVNHSLPHCKFFIAQELWSISIMWIGNDVQDLGPCRTTAPQQLKPSTVLQLWKLQL